MTLIPGPNNELTSQSYQPPIFIPPPGANIIVQDEEARLALDANEYEGMGVLQLEPSASLYIPHDGYWYMISSGEGSYPTLYASDIQNDSSVSGSSVAIALDYLLSQTGSSGGVTFATVQESYNGLLDDVAVAPNGLAIRKSGSAWVIGDLAGNARGVSALDIQSDRSSVTEVASGNYSVSVGQRNTSNGYRSSAIGFRNNATGQDSSTFGYKNESIGENSSAIGKKNKSNGEYSSAFGYSNISSGSNSSAFGGYNNANGSNACAFGYDNNADGLNSIAIGYGNESVGENASAIGKSNESIGSLSSAIGYNNKSEGSNSSGVGHRNNSSGENSSAIGYLNTSSGKYSSAFGYRVTTSTQNSQEFGYWSNDVTRESSVRIHGDGDVALTVKKTDTAKTDGGTTHGAESDGTLMRSGISFRVSSTNELIVEYNDGGVIRSATIATLS